MAIKSIKRIESKRLFKFRKKELWATIFHNKLFEIKIETSKQPDKFKMLKTIKFDSLDLVSVLALLEALNVFLAKRLLRFFTSDSEKVALAGLLNKAISWGSVKPFNWSIDNWLALFADINFKADSVIELIDDFGILKISSVVIPPIFNDLMI